MEGVIFDTKRLKKGLPVRWSLDGVRNNYGLISNVTDDEIIILAICSDKEFKEISYHISEFVEFELLGEWKK